MVDDDMERLCDFSSTLNLDEVAVKKLNCLYKFRYFFSMSAFLDPLIF